MTYKEKLLDPRWQKKRLEILKRDDFRCRDCYDSTKTLHIHHLNYIPGNDPWNYDEKFLLTLCKDCHEDVTNKRPKIEKELINFFRLKIKDTFQMDCVLQVFSRYEDLGGLFYMLWEMLDKQDEVDESLRRTLYPNTIDLSQLNAIENG